MTWCVTHNSYFDGSACVYAITHPEEGILCTAGVDPDYDPYWDDELGGEG